MLKASTPFKIYYESEVIKMIYNDINESNYTFKYDDLVFYFSSNFYKEKFIKEQINFIRDETMKLKIKFKCNIYCDEMILLLLYKKIEKRGFKVTYKDKELQENYYIDFNINDLSIKYVVVWQLDMIKN